MNYSPTKIQRAVSILVLISMFGTSATAFAQQSGVFTGAGGTTDSTSNGQTAINGQTSGTNAAAINGTANGSDAAAVNGSASGNNTFAVNGSATNSSGTSSTAINGSADANSVAIGGIATGGNATAVGVGAGANTLGTAVGDGAQAGSSASALGTSSTASGLYSLAFGSYAQATVQGGIAIGYLSSVIGLNAIAIGVGATAQNAYDISLGSFQTPYYGTAFATNGPGSYSNIGISAQGTLFSSNSVMVGSYASVVGTNYNTTPSNNTALGNNAQINGVNDTALGQGASVGSNTSPITVVNNSVALGAGTSTSLSNTVAIGNRTLSQVANATAGDQAVNLSQLQSAIAGVSGGSGATIPSVDYTNSTATNLVLQKNGGNGTTISNVAPGVAGSDAMTVSQGNQLANALGGGSTFINSTLGSPAYSFTDGQTYLNVGSALTDLDNRIFTNTSSINGINTALQSYANALGGGASYSATLGLTSPAYNLSTGSYSNVGSALTALDNRITALGTGSGSGTGTGSSIDPNAVHYDVGSSGSATIGGQLHGVQAGTSLTDATNVGQMNQAISTSAQTTLTQAKDYTDQSSATTLAAANNYTDTQISKIKLNGEQVQAIDYTKTTGTELALQSNNGQGTTISGVADGVNNKDAVNVEQLNNNLALSKSYTDNQVNNLQNNMNNQFSAVNGRIDDLSKRVDGVGAMAAANGSNMFNPSDSHDTQVGVGISQYRGATGYSVGVFRRISSNAAANLKISGATNSGGVAVSAGFNLGF